MATSWENRAVPTHLRDQQLRIRLAADFIRAISSVGQSNRLITGRSGVRVPDGPPKKAYRTVCFSFYIRDEKRTPKRLLKQTDWEKGPVDLSIVERRVPDGPQKNKNKSKKRKKNYL